MKKDSPLSIALMFTLVTFLLSLTFCWMIPGLPELFWNAFQEGGGPILPCLLLALMVGFLIWLNLKLLHLRDSCNDKIGELENQLRTLQNQLNNAKKD